MLQVLSSAWALLFGICLLMVGNGMQGTLLGLRGEIEGFPTWQMSIVMSGYFAGFLFGSRMAPDMIRRVGHVRVFAALASLISAVIVLYPTVTDPWVWTLARVLFGFCFSAVYVTAESWLNNAASNETRGQALSLYMIVQTIGLVLAQVLVSVADPAGFAIFVLPSILVSIAVTPILLSATPTPAFETTKPMTLSRLIAASPLACAGMFLLGGVFAAQFGMSSVFGTLSGFSVPEVSIFVAMFFVAAMLTQYPIGWMSDRLDRRFLVIVSSIIGCAGGILGFVGGTHFAVALAAAFLMGGMSNPLYSLLLAHANDYLSPEDMPAASGGLLFINGLGAVSGPLIVGWMMESFGPRGFYLFILVLFAGLAVYAMYRSTQRAAISREDTGTFVAMSPAGTTPVAMEIAQEWAIDLDQDTDQSGQGAILRQ